MIKNNVISTQRDRILYQRYIPGSLVFPGFFIKKHDINYMLNI